MKWQPIETAPKDVKLLIYTGHCVLFGTLAYFGPRVGHRWKVFGRFTKMIPTHWMPLPAPPQD